MEVTSKSYIFKSILLFWIQLSYIIFESGYIQNQGKMKTKQSQKKDLKTNIAIVNHLKN